MEREMLRLYGQVRRALCSGRQEMWDVEAALRQVNARINCRLGRRWHKWAGVAAVLMVGLGVSLLWLTGQEPDGARTEVAIVVDSILPGTERAELVLADGSRVVLDSKEGECMEVAVPVGFVNDRKGGVRLPCDSRYALHGTGGMCIWRGRVISRWQRMQRLPFMCM